MVSPFPHLATPIERVLSRFDRAELSGFISVALDLLDLADDDPDREDGNDDEPAGDERDLSWSEWQTRGRHKTTAGGHEASGSLSHNATDDDEDDDPDTCQAGDDGTASMMTYFGPQSGSEWDDTDREPDNDREAEAGEFDQLAPRYGVDQDKHVDLFTPQAELDATFAFAPVAVNNPAVS